MSSSTSSSRRGAWLAILALCAGAVTLAASRVLPRFAEDEDWNSGVARVLFVGSSHVRAGVRSPVLEPPAGVVSFAGMDVALADAVLRKHRHRWPALGLVVLEVDEFTLLTDTVAGIRDHLTHLCDRLGLSFWDLPAPGGLAGQRVGYALRGCSVSWLGPRHRLSLPRLRGRLVGRGGLFKPPAPPRPWSETGVALSRANAIRRAAYLERLAAASPAAAARNLAAVGALASRADREGWELALISFPKHRDFRRLRPPAWDAAIARAVTAAGAARGRPVAHWDLQDDPRFADGSFEDQDHLNASGAARLAPLLAELVASLEAAPGPHIARQGPR